MDPDVSAFTILEMLRQLGHDPALLEAALGSVYEQVIPLEPGAFDLWRDGQPYATAACADGTCYFSYWDHGPRVDAFAIQVTQWAETQVGPLVGDWPVRRAQNDTIGIEVNRAATGAESEIVLRLWTSPD